MGGSKKPEDQYSKKITFGITPGDYEKIMANYNDSTCQNHTEYFRRIFLHRRIILFYRNKSFDEFVNEAIRLRNEMQALREKLPATTPGLSALLAIQEEIKNVVTQIFNHVRQDQDQ